jgi:hypothetical protein
LPGYQTDASKDLKTYDSISFTMMIDESDRPYQKTGTLAHVLARMWLYGRNSELSHDIFTNYTAELPEEVAFWDVGRCHNSSLMLTIPKVDSTKLDPVASLE